MNQHRSLRVTPYQMIYHVCLFKARNKDKHAKFSKELWASEFNKQVSLSKDLDEVTGEFCGAAEAVKQQIVDVPAARRSSTNSKATATAPYSTASTKCIG